MLTQMSIRNFALIEHMNITFTNGITIFTGETGAGKSMLMNAFSILLGERASGDYIRHGKDSFVIDGTFAIHDNEKLLRLLEEKNIVVEDGTLILSRSFNRSGRSTILANDQPIPLKALREIGEELADIHGQYNNQQLLNPDFHHVYLDTYTTDGKSAYHSYVQAYKAYEHARKALQHLEDTVASRERELDMLRYQIDDIESAQLQVGEDVAIAEELKRLDSFEQIDKVLGASYDAFYNGRHPILDVINSIKSEVGDLVKVDDNIREISELLNSAYFQLEEAAQSLDRYRDSISYDEERYAYCQDRDSTIYGLKKKYGSTIEDILDFEEQAQQRLEALEAEVVAQDDLVRAVEETKATAMAAWDALHIVRVKNAKHIESMLTKEIHDLGMENGTISFVIEKGEALTALGADTVELLFSANKGEPLQPLHKVVSGGELARIALAFKSVFSYQSYKTMVFDEIDVGISGDIAMKVAEKILRISKHNQVFCITHLPQTASVGSTHYHLEKQEQDNRTVSTVRALTEMEHVEQIASMMSGTGMQSSALGAARELVSHFHGLTK